jgi:hypothetical protein
MACIVTILVTRSPLVASGPRWASEAKTKQDPWIRMADSGRPKRYLELAVVGMSRISITLLTCIGIGVGSGRGACSDYPLVARLPVIGE